jgi:hypothetical protein
MNKRIALPAALLYMLALVFLKAGKSTGPTQASLDTLPVSSAPSAYPDLPLVDPDFALFQWGRETKLLPELPSGTADPDAAIAEADFAAMLNAEARAYAPSAAGQPADVPPALVAHDPASAGGPLTYETCDALLRGLYGRDAPPCPMPSSGTFSRRDALSVLKDVLDRHLPDRCVRMPAMKSADFMIDGAVLCDLPR